MDILTNLMVDGDFGGGDWLKRREAGKDGLDKVLTPGLLKSGALTVWSGPFLLLPPFFGVLFSMMTIATFTGDVEKEKMC
jgi:hypothetical protein